MQVIVDRAGRFVVPKSVRERLGLRENSRLELEETAEGMILRPIEQGSGLVRRNGRLVFTGHPTGKINWDRLVQEDREERMRKIGGW
jgi:AbrB family looped-hinge helix DNA binding protein